MDGQFKLKTEKVALVCRHCKREFQYHHSSSSLTYHLRTKHAYCIGLSSFSSGKILFLANDCSLTPGTFWIRRDHLCQQKMLINLFVWTTGFSCSFRLLQLKIVRLRLVFLILEFGLTSSNNILDAYKIKFNFKHFLIVRLIAIKKINRSAALILIELTKK